MEAEFLSELQQYVGFLPAHAAALAALGPRLTPAFPAIVDRFYDAVAHNPRALAVFTGGEAQIARHKLILHDWLEGLFAGRYDDDYLARRARIGRSHVRIALDQRYMFTAMNVLREGLHDAVTQLADAVPLGHVAVDKICDLELAIMLEAYAEDYTLKLRDKERLATLGQLSGFIAHELRNPLSVMETSLHLLRRRLPPDGDAAARHADRIGDQLTISGNIIAALLELSRDLPLERAPMALTALVQSAVAGTQALDAVQLEVRIPDALQEVRLDATQVRQALVNLLTNAQQALANRADKRVLIAARREHDQLVLSVDDSGPGVADELRTRMFEPLVHGRDHGLGLGLALCRRVAEKHGGEIRALHSDALGGARFELRLADAFGDTPP